MKAIYHDHSNEGGVYRILNMATGKFYYGSTALFRKRFAAHKRTLEAGTHTNRYLLNEYKKHGPDNFIFEVVEVVENDTQKRLIAEQQYLDKFYDSQRQCLNLRKDVMDTRTGKKNNEPPNPLTDGRCKSPSEEVLEKRSKGIREAKSSPEAKQRARENCKNGLWKDHSANVKLKNLTTQEEVLVSGSLREFALSRGLSYKALHLMVSGKTKSSGGWVKTE